MSSVDIVVPCYNYGRFLGECVKSILSQEGVDLRVLIIDDASSDDSRELGGILAAGDDRVSFLRHGLNAGHIDTYNEGIEWSKAEYWMLISADDVLAPGALARALRIVETDSRIGLVGGADVVFSSSDELQGLSQSVVEQDAYEIMSGREFIRRSCQTASNLVSTPTAFVKLDLVKEIGGYRQELPQTADMEIQLQLAARSDVALLENVQAFKRIHASSMGRQEFSTRFDEIHGRKKAFDSFFGSCRHLLGSEAAGMQQDADRNLASDAFWYASSAFDQGESEACEMLLRLSEIIDPRALPRRNHLRLKLKRLIGPTMWKRLSPLVSRGLYPKS